MTNMKMNRRKFVKKSAGGALAVSSFPTILPGSSWKGANDRVNIAQIGIHGFGKYHIDQYNALDNVEVAALCDVDANLFSGVIERHFTFKGLKRPKTYKDLRKLYEDKDIDGVSITIPNHWHTLAAIWAIQAGKHVSVEKPCCHTFYEGQKLVEAAEKYDVIVQDGAEQRSNPCGQSMAKYLQSGQLGEVYLAKGICYKRRDSIGTYPDGPMAEGEKFAFTVNSRNYEPPYTKQYLSNVDYDIWQGPAAEQPFNRNRFHYNWHWNWLYGNGDMGNQGVHEMDVARWGLGVTLPTRVVTSGAHVMFDDMQNTPNVMMAMFEFDNPAVGAGEQKKMLQFEVRHWDHNPEGVIASSAQSDNTYMTSSVNTVGNLFYGSAGYMTKNVDEWKVFHGPKREPGVSGSGLGNHFQDFVNAIRAKDQKLAYGDIRDGFYSCALIHLANISYRLGRSLDFDPKSMKFVNDNEANAMLTKEYREPFVVPEKV
jgi:predicted dehydrogenase